MLSITEEQVRQTLRMPELVARLRTMFTDLHQGRAKNQVRRRLILDNGVMLHSLAGSWGEYFGTKIYTTSRDGFRFRFFLYDAQNGAPLADFEANYLGQLRTGGATGVAADLLARPDASVVASIGSGFQAESQIAAIRAVRDVRELRIWSRDAVKRAAFAQEQGGIACDTAAQACQDADIVITATFAKDPVITAQDIASGTLVAAMGSNRPAHAELPADLLDTAYVVVDDVEAAEIEAGDLIRAWGNSGWRERVTPLGALTAGADVAARADQVRVFKSVGLGVEDVAAAAIVYEALR